MTISGNLERFQYFNFKTDFLEKLEYRFLVESIKIKEESFPYKTVIPEANVLRQIEW